MDFSPSVVALGSAGTIGAALCNYLEASEIRVRRVPRSQCDLLDPKAVHQLMEGLGPDCTVVFTSVINRWKEDSFDAMAKNIAMVDNFANSAKGRIRSVIYLSSVDIYGRFPGLPIHENSQPKPESYYALAKFSGERLLLTALEETCPVAILRLPGVYGKDAEERSILGSFLKKLLHQEPITIFGDGSILRDFLFVDDVCEIIKSLILEPRPGTFNLATGQSLPLNEVLATLGRVLGKAPIIQFAPPKGGSASDLSFDIASLKNTFPAWVPTPLAQGSALFATRIQNAQL